jgi:galactokinase
MLIDCATLEITPVVVPDGVDVVVVHSGQRRALAATAYAERRAECDAAAALIGPLREADIGAAEAIADPVLRRRARHVVTENVRVMAMASALDAGDSVAAGALMDESHASLASDFEVSTPALDALVTRLAATPGVLGARLTGAGFGGCVVALAEPDAAVDGWRLQAAAGATVEVD